MFGDMGAPELLLLLFFVVTISAAWFVVWLWRRHRGSPMWRQTFNILVVLVAVLGVGVPVLDATAPGLASYAPMVGVALAAVVWVVIWRGVRGGG